jgi:hypothetical protein
MRSATSSFDLTIPSCDPDSYGTLSVPTCRLLPVLQSDIEQTLLWYICVPVSIKTAAEVAVCSATTSLVYPGESPSVVKRADQRSGVRRPVRPHRLLFGSRCRDRGPAEQVGNLRTEATMSLHVCHLMIGLCIKLPFQLQSRSIVSPRRHRRWDDGMRSAGHKLWATSRV